MLLIYNETGFITQTITVGDFKALKEVYESHGQMAIEIGPRDDFMNLYVTKGVAKVRPNVKVTGEVRPISADGADTLRFSITPKVFDLKIALGDTVVHEESSKSGILEFAVDAPGVYKLEFSAAFPRHPITITVEAQ